MTALKSQTERYSKLLDQGVRQESGIDKGGFVKFFTGRNRTWLINKSQESGSSGIDMALSNNMTAVVWKGRKETKEQLESYDRELSK